MFLRASLRSSAFQSVETGETSGEAARPGTGRREGKGTPALKPDLFEVYYSCLPPPEAACFYWLKHNYSYNLAKSRKHVIDFRRAVCSRMCHGFRGREDCCFKSSTKARAKKRCERSIEDLKCRELRVAALSHLKSSVESIINAELVHVKTWLSANKLSLNISKSNFVVFRPPQKKKTIHIRLSVNDKPLKEEHYIKNLGVMLDSHLNWKAIFLML